MVPLPRPGATVFVGRAASVQFGGRACVNFRIIRIDEQPTYDGWAWLDGYQLDTTGTAIRRRSIFIQPAGLRTPRWPAHQDDGRPPLQTEST